MRFQPVSKYRNAVGHVAAKDNWYADLQLATSSSDRTRLIHANHNWIAVKWADGRSIGLLPLDKPGKARAFQAHSAAISDWEFSNFDQNILATGAEDGMVKLWDISNASDPSCISTLSTISRRVEALSFHPTADKILSALGNEGKAVCIWDVESPNQPVLEISNPSSNPFQSFSWKADGRLLGTLGKGSLTVWDPRATESRLSSGIGHEGVKGSQVVWMGESNYLFTVGHNKYRSREYGIWDARNLATPLKKTILDSSSGITQPLYDEDTETMYLISRGDTTIHSLQFSELTSVPSVSENMPYGTTATIYGAALLPKKSLRVMEAEIARVLAVVDDAIMPVSFQVPRKQYIDFHADLYPDTKGNEYAVSGKEWLSGKDGQISKVSMRPNTTQSHATSAASATTVLQSSKEKQSIRTTNSTELQPENIIGKKQQQNDKELAPVEETSGSISNIKRGAKTRAPDYKFAKTNTYKYIFDKLCHPGYDDLRELSVDKNGVFELIQANVDFIAVPITGAGGRVGIIQVQKPGRLPTCLPSVTWGSPLTYFAFDPFDTHVLATASEDNTIRFWRLSDDASEAIASNLSKSLKDGSMDKISLIVFHPNARGVLLSASTDINSPGIRIWDLESGQCKIKFAISDAPLSAAWSPDGRKIAVHSKDRQLQIYDARSGMLIGKTESHHGVRPSRTIWISDDRVLSVGFGAGSTREVLVFDINRFEKPVMTLSIDVSPSVMSAFYDVDCRILYIAGRGDRTIHTFSVRDESLEPLAKLECASLQQGFAFLPKRTCHVDETEIARFFRLTPAAVEPHGIRLPRARPEYFQDDIFIPTKDIEHAAQDANSWFGGVDSSLSRLSLKPEQMISLSDAPPQQIRPKYAPAREILDDGDHQGNAMDIMFTTAKNIKDEEEKEHLASKEIDEVADDEWDD